MDTTLDLSVVLSGASVFFTTYFWLVKARKERPSLEFFQLSNFRAACRSYPGSDGAKRLCLQQIDTGGVLIVNHSTRQNSVVLFDCYLLTDDGEIVGDWGYGGEDKPPWNIGPESTIAFSPACFFEVPVDFEVPENPTFRIECITASGRRFSHVFHKEAPRLQTAHDRQRLAA